MVVLGATVVVVVVVLGATVVVVVVVVVLGATVVVVVDVVDGEGISGTKPVANPRLCNVQR